VRPETTFDFYCPFGAGAPTTGLRGKLMSDPAFRAGVAEGHVTAKLVWSHVLEVDEATDLRDGCTRAAGANAVTYADGDEVRIPDGSGTRYVVVWVEKVMSPPGCSPACKRAYLLRHAAAWPGP
jgi:hypothetical protein